MKRSLGIGCCVIGAFAACSTGETPHALSNGNSDKGDRAGLILDLSDARPKSMYLECEDPEGCDISLRASLRAPAFCELFPDERSCGAGTTSALELSIATVAVETPEGDVHEARIAIRSEDGRDFETVVKKGELAAQPAGAYFIDVARASEVEHDLQIAFDARWDATAGERVRAWTQARLGDADPARDSFAMTYDRARERLVVFGGYHWAGYWADTWEWDGGDWQERTSAAGPLGRISSAMAYDAAAGQAVLFGGFESDTRADLADTWVWDGREWEEVTPASSPTARSGHAMVYDEARQRVVLFGGSGPMKGGVGGSMLGDTWTWDGSTWREVTPASGSPSPRMSHAMAYDSDRERVVLFGGRVRGSSVVGDTWEWDGSRWHEVETDDPSPPARSHHAMAYDPSAARVVLFGGGEIGRLHRWDDTWAWDGSVWKELTPTGESPQGRHSHAMAYADSVDALVLFGGSVNTDLGDRSLSDTWLWRAD